jgi:hypothetical protein
MQMLARRVRTGMGIKFGIRSREGHTLETIAEKQTTVTAPGPGLIGRRREVHCLTNDAVEIEVLPGPSPRIGAWLMDLTRSGVRLWLKTLITKDAGIKIRLRSGTTILGKVRYCRPRDGGFETSILIQDVACSREARNLHVNDGGLFPYLVGKRLTVTGLKGHLGRL